MVTVSNLRRLERLEAKSAATDTEYENFIGNVLEARMKAAVREIADRGFLPWLCTVSSHHSTNSA